MFPVEVGGSNPAAVPGTRTAILSDLLTRAGTRAVYGMDRRGHGGRVTADSDKTDGWCVPVGTLVMAEIEGIPGSRVRLPLPPRTA